jgi:hypothetical protein
VVPSKIIGIALNYPDNPPLPGNAGPGPGYFAKLPSAVIGDHGRDRAAGRFDQSQL